MLNKKTASDAKQRFTELFQLGQIVRCNEFFAILLEDPSHATLLSSCEKYSVFTGNLCDAFSAFATGWINIAGNTEVMIIDSKIFKRAHKEHEILSFYVRFLLLGSDQMAWIYVI